MTHAHLNQAQRYQIQKLSAEGKSPPAIAARLGVHRSTIYRELRRGKFKGSYCAATAHERSVWRRRASAANHRLHPPELWRWVRRQLCRQWSPEQISHRLKVAGSAGDYSVSTQAIYDWLRRTRSPLIEHLRQSRDPNPWRGPRCGMPKGRPSIRKRPPEVLTREQAGHWEGDTIQGHSKKHCMVTLVERKSLYTLVSRTQRKRAEGVADYIRQAFVGLPALSLTLDNGTEFAQYAAFGLPVYFADPGRPRQRSRNENTNGLIRQYIPKTARLEKLHHSRARFVADRLNHRPRKTLGYKTPHEVLFNLMPTPVAIRA